MGWRMLEKNGVQWNLSHPCSPFLLHSPHFSLHSLAYHYLIPCLCLHYLLFQIPSNKICPTIVLHLATLSSLNSLFVLMCDPPLLLFPECFQVYTADICPFALFPPGQVQVISHFYSPQNSLSSQNTKGFLICGLCFYLINWEEVYSAVAAETFLFLKFPFLHYRPVIIYNITLIHTVIRWTSN